MDSHKDFILSPIIDILKELVAANAGIGSGIETFPLSEYVLQSAFLKMTGSQEQKMKCICWELATNDYEYRYKRYTQNPLGECSNYDEKKIVYKDIISQIKKNYSNFNISTIIKPTEIIAKVQHDITSLFEGSNISSWSQINLRHFSQSTSFISPTQIGQESNLLESALQARYKQVYSHRNRCAHNTMSYQQNLPTLSELNRPEYIFDNYFCRFSILVLIDEIFMLLYKEYLSTT